MGDLATLLDAYLLQLETFGKYGSVKQARHHAKVLRRVCGDDASFLDPETTRGFINGRRAEGVTDASINGALRIAKAAYRAAGLHPAIRLLRVGRKRASILTGEERRRLDLALDRRPHGIRLGVLLALDCGLRRGEIEHLRGVDVQDGWVHVTGWNGWTPKAYHERSIPVTKRVAQGIYGVRLPLSEPMVQEDLEEPIRELFRELGVGRERKPGLHMLRRTWASRCAAAGIDLPTLMEMAGWEDAKTAMGYLTSSEEQKTRVVAALDNEEDSL